MSRLGVRKGMSGDLMVGDEVVAGSSVGVRGGGVDVEKGSNGERLLEMTEAELEDCRPAGMEREPRDLLHVMFYVALAGVVGLIVWYKLGRERATEYVTAYVVEQSLSVDNLFVFLLVFNHFRVPRGSQEPVLFWGILGAMVLRGIMIVLGEQLVRTFRWLYIIFALILLYSAYKLLVEEEGEEENLENNSIVRFCRRWVSVSDRYHGRRFFVREGGRWVPTPLFLVLMCIELSDVVFAMDSVPAVLGLSDNDLVIYSSNIMAVMGLRSMFFVISDAISSLRYLKQSLAMVLGFVALKMVLGLAGWEVETWVALAIVAGILGAGILLSLMSRKFSGGNVRPHDSGPIH